MYICTTCAYSDTPASFYDEAVYQLPCPRNLLHLHSRHRALFLILLSIFLSLDSIPCSVLIYCINTGFVLKIFIVLEYLMFNDRHVSNSVWP